MDLKMKVGPKGQVVIPKQMREQFHILPGDMVFCRTTNEGVLYLKPLPDPVGVFRQISSQLKKKSAIDLHGYEREIEEKWKRSST